MRATLNIPDDLITEVQKISKEKSKTKAIVTAMEAYVRDKKMTALRALRGKIPLAYDWKQGEAAELKAQKKRDKYLER
ncbi:MAG: type II toxin-antitoxin system VapB family antitoxin [Syntrophales bacterium]